MPASRSATYPSVEAVAEYCLSSHQLVLERCKPIRSNRTGHWRHCCGFKPDYAKLNVDDVITTPRTPATPCGPTTNWASTDCFFTPPSLHSTRSTAGRRRAVQGRRHVPLRPQCGIAYLRLGDERCA